MFHMKLIYNGECDFDSSYIECMKHATPKVKSNEKMNGHADKKTHLLEGCDLWNKPTNK